MTILKKIKRYGIKSAFEIVLNRVLFVCFSILPLKSNWIGFESRGDMTDNAYALFEYMWTHGYDKKYRAIWYVTDKDKAKLRLQRNGFNNVVLSSNNLNEKLNLKRIYYLATSKYYIYDHDCLMSGYKKRKNQITIYITHGISFKKIKDGKMADTQKAVTDYLISLGNYSDEILNLALDFPEDRILNLGYPRIDYFYQKNDEQARIIEEKYKLQQFSKTIIWMPTFRRSNIGSLSDEISSETGLPLLRCLDDLVKFDNYLKNINVLLILKIHPLQANLDVFKCKFQNIKFISNEMLEELDIQLYQFIPLFDGLISDYSSITFDYLLLHKPIIYTLDDYDEYKKNRGFLINSPLDYMVGSYVYNIEDLKESIQNVLDNDKYLSERDSLIEVFHSYKDGDSCKRIIDFLKL